MTSMTLWRPHFGLTERPWKLVGEVELSQKPVWARMFHADVKRSAAGGDLKNHDSNFSNILTPLIRRVVYKARWARPPSASSSPF
jgi:hypothetical protein